MHTDPILITGSHRSGTTWTGKMLDLSDETGLIYEPFNPDLSICQPHFRYWYTYVCSENEDLYTPCIEKCLNFRYPPSLAIGNMGSYKQWRQYLGDKYRFLKYGLLNRRPLFKDPISLFSAEWLYKKFDMRVVVLIRHPAAFVGSLKKAGWTFPFEDFLHQPLLMRDHLLEFEEDIRSFSEDERDIVDQGILLWNIIQHVIRKYRSEYEDSWIFLRHEDLSYNPVITFKALYDNLGLKFTPVIRSQILEYSRGGDNQESELKRNSRSNIWSWQNRLTQEEIERVKQGTQEISKAFYSEEDWSK